MSEQTLPQHYPPFGLDSCLLKIQNVRGQTRTDDPRLGLAEQSIQAALHWLSQPPIRVIQKNQLPQRKTNEQP